MQLISPSLISGEIMALIDEADEKIVLISPYLKVSKWYKFRNKLEAAQKRKLNIEIFVREGEFETYQEAIDLGLHPIVIPNLHTKLYFNEKKAIVSSMNLLLSSDTNSLDIALKTESEKEYNEIVEYYNRYISKNANTKQDIEHDWCTRLDNKLREVLGKEARITEYDSKLVINTRNKYEVFIANERTNLLRIMGILSQKEFDFAKSNTEIIQSKKIRVELNEGKNGHYNTIWGTVVGLKSRTVNEIDPIDVDTIIDCTVGFINGIEQLKRLCK
jgi:hypothetical protein